MKKIFLMILICLITIFSGCSSDKSKISEQQNEKTVNADNEKKYYEKLSEADKLILNKDYEGARTTLMQAMVLNREEASLYSRLGFVNHCLKKYSDSFWSFDEAIKLAPNFSLAYENRGNLNYDLENYEDAINDYTKALQLDVMFPKHVYMRRGNCYYNLGKYTEARWDYSTVVDLDKYNAEAYFKLGIVYTDLGDDEKAFENFEKAKKLGYFKNN